MSKIERFEDMEICQKSMDLAVNIYKVIHNSQIKLEYAVQNQVINASLSISNNIAEGFEYNSNNQFIKFLTIAKGSCGELRNQIYYLNRIGFIVDQTFTTFLADCIELSKKISSLITYLCNLKKTK